MRKEKITTHKIIFSNSNNMKEIQNKTINLVVTSPPYPMIEMWDELFSANPEIDLALKNYQSYRAYNLMHEELNKTWKEVDRVLIDSGIVCINIGDATRSVNDSFQLYPNHSRITYYFEKMGYHTLPSIIWKKESNKPNKFMGSGMLPPNAYITLEHEYILIFRKGELRNFETQQEKANRHNSAYFWEERNKWFSDVWNDVKGTLQLTTNNQETRDRSAAYPFEIPYRLINMFSVEGDTILDTYTGTGTTTIAAMCSGRNFIGYELDPKIFNRNIFENENIKDYSNNMTEKRIYSHIEFIKDKQTKYSSNIYRFNVTTNQETEISLPIIKITKKVSEKNEIIEYETIIGRYQYYYQHKNNIANSDIYKNIIDENKFRSTNIIWNELHLNSPSNIGYVSMLVESQTFNKKEEWENYYYQSGETRKTLLQKNPDATESELKNINYYHGRTKNEIEEMGKVLFNELIKKDNNKNNLSLNECIECVRYRTICETWNGIIIREHNTVENIKSAIPEILIIKTPAEIDFKYAVDYEIFNLSDKSKGYGIQIKPSSYNISTNNSCDYLRTAKDINKKKNEQYKQDFHRDVLYIFSNVNGDIINKEIIPQIKNSLSMKQEKPKTIFDY